MKNALDTIKKISKIFTIVATLQLLAFLTLRQRFLSLLAVTFYGSILLVKSRNKKIILTLMLLLFVPITKEIVVPTSVIIFSIYCFFAYFYLLKRLNINTSRKLLYFILYLCTFEIGPLLFIWIVVLKNMNI